VTRWALRLEYDGTGYVGWQLQENGLSLQALLEAAAAHLRGGLPVASVVAGRTDAGVHASGQVASIELPDRFEAKTVQEALNFHLKPHPLVVLEAAPVADGWNPRFDAVARTYIYVILNRRARPGLDRRVWHVPQHLDAAAMQQAASSLLGRHDFSSFRAAACQANSPWRTLDVLDVTRDGDRVAIRAEARSFLHHQVRNMVGTLRLVGEGRWSPARVAAALAACHRSAAGPTAPPDGLTLSGVRYAADPFSPAAPDRSPAAAPPH